MNASPASTIPCRILAGLSLLALAAPLARAAADSSSTPPPPQKETSTYTDRGTTRTEVTVSSDPYFYNNSFGGFGSSRYPFNDYSGFRSYTVTTQQRPIYFPPLPPPLGEPIPANAGRATFAKLSPPGVLANYVYEPFYAPLSPLLFTENLDRRRREKLDAYRAARLSALDALHHRLDSLQNADPATRQAELAAFAAQQAPALVALENTAEEMRDNFVNGGFFQAGSDWNESRGWRLGDDTRWESTLDELKVMTGAAFFQDGLLPAQRRLLREFAMELSDSMRPPSAEISLDAPGPFFYFSPETARIRLPADLPPELAEKIAAYQEQKASLKRELRDVLYKKDRSFFESTRINALKALAAQQAPRLAAVEQLAEEIRVGLAPLPNPASPPALPLPRELVGRINAYLNQKSDWQRSMVARLEALRVEFPEDRVEFLRQGNGLIIQIVGNRRANAEITARRETAQTALAAFNADQARRYASLAREKESIRTEVLKIASNSAGLSTNRTIDQLVQQFAYAFGQQERWERYHDYEIAVLQPGLSPEQRRLLFGAAVEKLDLPLTRF